MGRQRDKYLNDLSAGHNQNKNRPDPRWVIVWDSVPGLPSHIDNAHGADDLVEAKRFAKTKKNMQTISTRKILCRVLLYCVLLLKFMAPCQTINCCLLWTSEQVVAKKQQRAQDAECQNSFAWPHISLHHLDGYKWTSHSLPFAALTDTGGVSFLLALEKVPPQPLFWQRGWIERFHAGT